MIEFKKEDIFLVTGASSGIGQGVALKLNELGATVIATGRSLSKLEETKNNSAHPENIFLEPKNLTENIDELPLWVKSLKEKYGKLRGLVCCAGIIDDQPLSCIEEISAKNLFDTNYFAPIFLAKGFADRRVSIKGIASITFIASISALLGDKSQTIYGGSKAALIASAKTISHELAPAVRVNCISPGPVNTPMTTRAIEQHGHYNTLDGLSLGVGEPDDVANLTVFLVSDKARWKTGQNYILDGGYI